jgi:hypothetical protein
LCREYLIHRSLADAVCEVRHRCVCGLGHHFEHEALGYPGVPAQWRTPDFTRTPLPVIPVEFSKDGLGLSYFSAVTTLGTPQDAMLQEIRLESFFPADEATAAHSWERRTGPTAAKE